MKQTLVIAAMLCISLGSLKAESIEQIKNMASTTQTKLKEGSVSGVVISDLRSPNSETNPNLAWNKVDVALSLQTIYIQDNEGANGLRVVLRSIYENKFKRGTEVQLDLQGASIIKDENSGAVTIYEPKSVRVIAENVQIKAKERTISELQDSDIYTLVSVTDLEYLNKQGSFLNIYELCAQCSRLNELDIPQHSCDSWAAMMLDSHGNHIYLQLNSRLTWRRNCLDFPKGRGSVTGVVVNSQNRRYGVDFGRYSLRPAFRSDIALEQEESSAYKTVAAFRWDKNFHQELNFVGNGPKRWLGRKDIKNDAVRAEQGNAILYNTCGAYYSLDTEYDARHATDGSGMGARAAGALRLDGDCADWFIYNNGRIAGYGAIVIETSTAGVQGEGLVFNFSMLAGNHSIKLSYGFPALWTVTYSTDGSKFKPTGLSFMLKPIAYNRDMYEKKFYPTSYDAAMGFPEFSIKLPATLLGQEKLYLRISPMGDTITELYEDPSIPIASGKMAQGYEHPYCIRIGMAELKTY